ncbi:mannosyltransferase [Planotetraspora thailandica]|uniref:Mannosyltransferase n=1 Tax=Planotetraspora thailandica TaxID=487172 RepID=A0A8J3XUY4_9ACTN|nr:glycosyltransferase family 39 protein [Planotetraspora thailandica]GII53121.1 mannosyltransferase [Planotetraspora thailandica]
MNAAVARVLSSARTRERPPPAPSGLPSLFPAGRRWRVPRPDPCLAVPALLALAAGLWGLTSPPLWRDEAATVSAVSRSLPQLAHLLGTVDAVHGVYYGLMHVVAAVAGTGEVALRLPSVLAGALAAAGVGALGRALGNPRAGLYGGALLAMMPVFSRYVQEARPYPLTMAVAIAATLLLLRAMRRPTWRVFLAYGLALVGLAFVNLFAVLIAAAHGVFVVWSRGPAMRWAVSAACASAAVTPLALLAARQSEQIGWISTPDLQDAGMLVVQLLGDLGAATPAWAGIAPVVGGLALVGLASVARVARRVPDSPRDSHVGSHRGPVAGALLVRLALPWLLGPPIVLLAVSWAGHPVYVFRYVLCCVPAAALLAGAGLAALPRRAALALLAVVLAASVPGQFATRGADGRQDDPGVVMAVLASAARPGDGVLFIPGKVRKYVLVYPGVLGRLDDVSLARSPRRTGTFGGTHVGRRVMKARLADVHTLWALGNTGRTANWQLDALRGTFSPTGHWTTRGMYLVRYTRTAP